MTTTDDNARREPVDLGILPAGAPMPEHRPPPPEGNDRSVVRGLASTVGLLLLLVGPPLLLATLAGWPLPHKVPNLDSLTQQLGAEQVVNTFVVIAWLLWLQFVICVVVELVSALRGVGLPAKVPFAGANQNLARTLVTGVLLLATVSGTAATAAAATATPGPPAGSTQTTVSQSFEQAIDQAQNPVVQQSEQVQVVTPVVTGQKLYVVQPPQGRHHDNLWDIAERHLGDGRRYKEIYALNKNRPQPDGDRLERAALIRPGWQLILPADAVGSDLKPAHGQATLPTIDGQHADDSGSGTGVGGRHAAADSPDGTQQGPGGGGGQQTSIEAADPSNRNDLLPWELTAGGLLCAGLAAALERRRRQGSAGRPGEDVADAEVALRLGQEPELAHFLDRTLRGLSVACESAGMPLPPVHSVRLTDTGLELAMTPGVPQAPGSWTVEDGGNRWVLSRDMADLTAITVEGVPAPYPGLVTVGHDGTGALVLVDLESAGGPISVVGDPHLSGEVVLAAAVELATNLWSDDLRVTLVGLPAPLQALSSQRVRHVDTLSDVLPELEARAEQRAGLAQLAGGEGVLTGRLAGHGQDAAWSPEFLVLGRPPAPEEVQRLDAVLAAPGRTPLGVLAAGELPTTRWRWEIAAAESAQTGSAQTGPVMGIRALGLEVIAQRLPAAQVRQVLGLFRTPPQGPSPSDPVGDESVIWSERPAIPQVFIRRQGLVPTDDCAVAVAILGPLRATVSRPIEPGYEAAARELLVYLALHPDGAHPSVLAGAIWPRGVTNEVRLAMFRRTVDWLGTDGLGSPLLATAEDGRMSLRPGVGLDWAEFCALLARSRENADEEVLDLRRALRLVRGPLLPDLPAGRYSWLARESLEYDVPLLVADATHRLAALLLDSRDAAGSGEAVRTGLKLASGNQLLWRDLVRSEYAQGGAPAVAAVLQELRGELARNGLGEQGIEPETNALVAELLPDHGLTGSA